jgi:hypothetical protein
MIRRGFAISGIAGHAADHYFMKNIIAWREVRLWACASSGDVIALSVFTLSSKLGSVSSSRSASRGRGNDTAGEGKFASFRQNVMQKTKLEDLEVMEMLMGAILRRLRAPRQQ